MCDANIFIRFDTKLYKQTAGIPKGTNCAPLVADLFLFCYERDFVLSLSDNNQAFNSTLRYLDDLLNNNLYFEQMVDQIYLTELQLNEANSFDTGTLYTYMLHLCIGIQGKQPRLLVVIFIDSFDMLKLYFRRAFCHHLSQIILSSNQPGSDGNMF